MQRLEDLPCHTHLLRPVAIRLRRQGHANRVSDPVDEKRGDPSRGRYDSLGAHPRLGQPQVKRIVASGGEHPIDTDEIRHLGDLGAEDDHLMPQPGLFRQERRSFRTFHDRVQQDRPGILRIRAQGVLIHHFSEEALIEGAPVHPDPHGRRVLNGYLHDLLEVGVPVFGPDIARVDTVFRKCLGARRELGEKQMAVVMKIADDGHGGALIGKPRHDFGDSSSRGLVVDRHAHQLTSGLRPRLSRRDRSLHVRRIGVRHRLDDHRILTTDLDPSDVYDDGGSSSPMTHVPP